MGGQTHPIGGHFLHSFHHSTKHTPVNPMPQRLTLQLLWITALSLLAIYPIKKSIFITDPLNFEYKINTFPLLFLFISQDSESMLSLAPLLLAAASLALAEQKNLYIKSSNNDVDGRSLYAIHEGAGINYVFLSATGSTLELDFDESAGTLSQPMPGATQYSQMFTMLENYVAMAITGSAGIISFDDNTMLFNGSANGFYACTNTGDPYRYSLSSYELMYFAHDKFPASCLPVTLVNRAAGASSGASSGSASTSTSGSASASVSSEVSSTTEVSSSEVPSSTVHHSSSSEVSSSSSSSSTLVPSSFHSTVSSSETSSVSLSSVKTTSSHSGHASTSESSTVSSVSSKSAGAAGKMEVSAGAALLGMIAALI